MGKDLFIKSLNEELNRIDNSKSSKRNEKIIEGFTKEDCPKALIAGKKYILFNSNDYLGLRFNKEMKNFGEEAAENYGVGPGAVRFISGTMKIHKDLEKAIAEFHNKEDSIIFSSAFAANVAVISTLINGQSSNSIISKNVLILSDELNHRSIIEGIRSANVSKEQKLVFRHLDVADLENILSQNSKKFDRVIIITDGIFSMLGTEQKIFQIREVIDKFDSHYNEGILFIIDDAHGVGCFGKTGRGSEEASGAKSDLLIGTMGKAFGVDGGYIAGDKLMIDYLRESAATYVYSNPIPPSSAAASLKAISLISSKEGEILLNKLRNNINYFKEKIKSKNIKFASDSNHPIQAILVGDSSKAKMLTDSLFGSGIIVTNISFPVVPQGRDEIRVQISAAHNKEEIDYFVDECTKYCRDLEII